MKVFALTIAVLIGCTGSQPRLDTTTENTWLKSMKQIRKSMKESDFERMQDQANELAFSSLEADEILGNISSIHKFMDGFHGMTGPEILTYTDSAMMSNARIEEENKDLAERMRQQEASMMELMSASLVVTLYEKGFYASNFQEYINMKFGFENRSEKDISGFKGTVIFRDMFDDEIKGVNLKHDDPILAGETVRWEASLEFNQFVQEDVELKSKSLDKIKVEWRPESIIFSDGSTLKKN